LDKKSTNQQINIKPCGSLCLLFRRAFDDVFVEIIAVTLAVGYMLGIWAYLLPQTGDFLSFLCAKIS